MKKVKITLFVSLLLIVLVLLNGCWNNNLVEDKIYGTWEYTYSVDNKYFQKNSKEPTPKDLDINMEIKGTQSYYKNGIYNAIATLTLKYKTLQGEASFRYIVKDAGEWRLYNDGKELIETSVDSTFTPIDKISEDFLKDVPAITALFQPLKGATATSIILSVSNYIMEVKIDGFEETLKMNKK